MLSISIISSKLSRFRLFAYTVHIPVDEQEGSISDRILRHVTGPEPLVLRVDRVDRVPLQGQELDDYMIQQGQAVEVVVEEEMMDEEEIDEEGTENDGQSAGVETASAGVGSNGQDGDLEGKRRAAEMEESMIQEGILSWQVDAATGALPTASEDLVMSQSMRERFEGLLALRRSSSLKSMPSHVDEDGLAITAERRVLTEGFDIPQV
jgi:hypothetical protein